MRLALDDTPVVVADDEHGAITYHPGAIDATTAQAWFEQLRAGVHWQAERRRMYDRDVDVPRLTAHLALDSIRDAAPSIAGTRGIAQRIVGCTFNAVGLNLYRDGNDSVALHNDKLYRLETGTPIALVSLGAARRMTIRTKQAPRRSLHVELESGSVLVMTYATQLHYDHGIAKTRVPVAARISLAFRRLRASALENVGAWR